MLNAISFAFHVTYTCPLACAHCCFGSSPRVRDSLDPEDILAMIDQLPATLNLVAFTGGEPFLHGHNLVRYVRRAHDRRFRTRVVTSAYFGKTATIAKERLLPLVQNGLDELSISWDDYHEEFVTFDTVRNVVEAAISLGLRPGINSVQSAKTKWTRQRIMEQLGPAAERVELVCETTLNLTGRAQEQPHSEGSPPNGFLGPCPYILTGPTMGAKSNLLACCGVIPETERLVIQNRPEAARIDEYIGKSLTNPLFLWLFMRGPYALIEAICEKYDIPLPERDAIGGNCEACRILFTSRVLEERIDDILREKLTAIAGEMLLLESLGLMEPGAVQGLWHDKCRTRAGV
jgi:organic radical activating enzyme